MIESSSGNLGDIQLEVGLSGHKSIDYDRKAMRTALRVGAAQVRKEARRLVSRRAVSMPGEDPGMQTGALKRAIGMVSKGSRGGWIKVGVRSIPGSVFYPAFLFYGSPKINLAKRANFMEEALANKRETVREQIRAALKNSLVPR